MNSEFWNIFQWNSIGFSDRIPIGIVPSPVGLLKPKMGDYFYEPDGSKSN
jgi:hypothetical protein